MSMSKSLVAGRLEGGLEECRLGVSSGREETEEAADEDAEEEMIVGGGGEDSLIEEDGGEVALDVAVDALWDLEDVEDEMDAALAIRL